jgi:hypothetical protein
MAIRVTLAIQETLEQQVVKVIRGMTVPKAIQAKRVQVVEPQSLLCQPKHHQQNKFVSVTTHQLLGETHELRNHTVDYSDLDFGRRTSQLATQQELGLWAEWWYWPDRAHYRGVVGHGADLTRIVACAVQIGELCVG